MYRNHPPISCHSVLVLAVWAALGFQTANADPPEENCLPADVEFAWTDPPDGYVDTKQFYDTQATGSVHTLAVEFSTPVDLDTNCVEVITTGEDAPEVAAITGSGSSWTIELNTPIPAGEATAFSFGNGVLSVVVHSHPGDVNLDGVTNADDFTELSAAIAANPDTELHDFNRDGVVGLDDAGVLLDFVSQPVEIVWNEWVSAGIKCCCTGTTCSVIYGEQCPDDDEEIACPCVPNPCQNW